MVNIVAVLSIGIICFSMASTKVRKPSGLISVFDEDPNKIDFAKYDSHVSKAKFILKNRTKLVISHSLDAVCPCISFIFHGGYINIENDDLLKIEKQIFKNKLEDLLKDDLNKKIIINISEQVRSITIKCSSFNIYKVIKLISNTIENLKVSQEEIELAKKKILETNNLRRQDRRKALLLTQDITKKMENYPKSIFIKKITTENIINLWRAYCDPSRTLVKVHIKSSESVQVLNTCIHHIGNITDKLSEQEEHFSEPSPIFKSGRVFVINNNQRNSINIFWKNLQPYYSTSPNIQRPENLIVFLLLDKGSSSIYNILKSEGLIEDIKGEFVLLKGIGEICITIYPTEKGLSKWQYIVKSVIECCKKNIEATHIASHQLKRHKLYKLSNTFPIERSSLNILESMTCKSLFTDFSFFPYYDNVPCFFDQKAFWNALINLTKTLPDVVIRTGKNQKINTPDINLEKEISDIDVSEVVNIYSLPKPQIEYAPDLGVYKKHHCHNQYTGIAHKHNLNGHQLFIISSILDQRPYNTWMIEIFPGIEAKSIKDYLIWEITKEMLSISLKNIQEKSERAKTIFDIQDNLTSLKLTIKCWEETAQELLMNALKIVFDSKCSTVDLKIAKSNILNKYLIDKLSITQQILAQLCNVSNPFKSINENLNSIYIADITQFKNKFLSSNFTDTYFIGNSTCSYVLSFWNELLKTNKIDKNTHIKKTKDIQINSDMSVFSKSKTIGIISLGKDIPNNWAPQSVFINCLKHACKNNASFKVIHHFKEALLLIFSEKEINIWEVLEKAKDATLSINLESSENLYKSYKEKIVENMCSTTKLTGLVCTIEKADEPLSVNASIRKNFKMQPRIKSWCNKYIQKQNLIKIKNNDI